MTKKVHRFFLAILVFVVIAVTAILIYTGIQYYRLPLEERVYNASHQLLKPSGTLGHGIGIIGSFLMILGMVLYMARKRYRIFSRMGQLKHWLEFHIFLCTLGPIMILFHTTFKFGGLVAISFWSMVAVFLSGIIGRFIYIQIPRSIEGRELGLSEIKALKSDFGSILKNTYKLNDETCTILADSVRRKVEIYNPNPVIRYFRNWIDDNRTIKTVKKVLHTSNLNHADSKRILDMVQGDIHINRKIERLDTMQNLFKYWHVAHLPFALVMLIIMVIHVGVTIVFGYHWIF
jgi:hypothetical protein